MSSTPTILTEKCSITYSTTQETHEFWIAYPREVAIYESMPDRMLLAWGRGMSAEEALEAAQEMALTR